MPTARCCCRDGSSSCDSPRMEMDMDAIRRSSDVDVPSSGLYLMSVMSVMNTAVEGSENSSAVGLLVKWNAGLRGRRRWEVDFDVVWVHIWMVAFVLFESFLGGLGDLVSVWKRKSVKANEREGSPKGISR